MYSKRLHETGTVAATCVNVEYWCQSLMSAAMSWIASPYLCMPIGAFYQKQMAE